MGTTGELRRVHIMPCRRVPTFAGDGPGLGKPISEAELDVANYVPHATTIFDYTRRAMPWQQPKTLTNDEVYAVTAYILALNKIIGDNDVMNADSLPKVKMPNRDGFVSKYPERK
jgi:cytochrome c